LPNRRLADLPVADAAQGDFVDGNNAMTRSIRILLAAFAAAFAFAGATTANAGSITLSDPNCDSFAVGGSAGAQTLTCIVSSPPTCTVQGSGAGSIGTPVTLTAQCSPAATSWAWTGGNCVNATTQICQATSAGAGVVGYTVKGTNAIAQGGVSPVFSVTWSSGPPPNPTGCVASISTVPTVLTNAGGTATVSVSGCSPANVTYNWSKNGAAGWSASATPPTDTLGTGGAAGYTNSYQVSVCNGASCVNVPTANPLTAFVPGTGGGSSIDVSACTALGYTGHGVDIAYPTTANSTRVFTDKTVGNFGANDMIVVRFVAASAEANGSNLVASEWASYPAAFRLATLSTAPCVVATSPTASGTVIASKISQAPGLNMSLTPLFGVIKLTPGATYYVNYVNRDAYNSTSSSCNAGNCGMYIDFNN
jgi:hypothetical protein